MDLRNALPKPFLAFYPGLIDQKDLDEAVNLIGKNVSEIQRIPIGPPKTTEPLTPRDDYETKDPIDLDSLKPTVMAPLGDIALARSGDKGANVNLGLFVQTDEEWDWLRTFMTKGQMRKMMGTDWQDWYFIERVEMPRIRAVHFVVYGPLGRGVTSSKLLDALGKGFGEFIRDVHVPIPRKFLDGHGATSG